MSKKTGLYLMLAGAAVSVIDLVTAKAGEAGGMFYGPGKPLEKMRWKVFTSEAKKDYYVSISDAAALAGAYIYFF
jgi:hypothetical protein